MFCLCPLFVKNGHFPVYCVLWYSAGVMPVIRLKNFEKKEGLGKFSSSDIWNQQIAVFQQYFRFKNNGLVDPLHYRLSACLTYNGAQVMRGQA